MRDIEKRLTKLEKDFMWLRILTAVTNTTVIFLCWFIYTYLL